MICFLRSLSRYAIQVGVSKPNIISLYLLMWSLMASSSSSFVFIQFQRGIFNFFASSSTDVLFIYYYFCYPRQVTKIFWSSFYTSKNPSSSSSSSSSSSHSMLHCWFSASVYLRSSTYT